MRRDLEVDGAVVASCTRPTRTHLTACGIALVALAVSALLLAAVAERAEARARGGLTFVLEGQRARGLAMQRAALADRNVLMLYGASELARPVPLRAQEFFASAPTGFRAFSVGERGTPLLMNLQSIVALGEALRGRRVAIFLTIDAFLHASSRSALDSAQVAAFRGTFSMLHAAATLFSPTLSAELKREIAKRLVRVAPLFDGSPLLGAAVRLLADPTPLHRIEYALLYPFGRLMVHALEMQDHAVVLGNLTLGGVVVPSAEQTPRPVDWEQLRSEGDAMARRASTNNPYGYESGFYERQVLPKREAHRNSRPDSVFLAELREAAVWDTLELLIRALREHGATPLFVCSPFKGVYADFKGTSPAARSTVYAAIRDYARRQQIALVTFEAYDADPYFLVDQSHPSPKGWAIYNEALDAFVHDRLD